MDRHNFVNLNTDNLSKALAIADMWIQLTRARSRTRILWWSSWRDLRYFQVFSLFISPSLKRPRSRPLGSPYTYSIIFLFINYQERNISPPLTTDKSTPSTADQIYILTKFVVVGHKDMSICFTNRLTGHMAGIISKVHRLLNHSSRKNLI